MQLFINKKEVPTLILAIEEFISRHPQSKEAQELLTRIIICQEKQDRKTKKTK